MYGKINVSIKCLIPEELKGGDMYEIARQGVEKAVEVLSEYGIVLEDYKIKISFGD